MDIGQAFRELIAHESRRRREFEALSDVDNPLGTCFEDNKAGRTVTGSSAANEMSRYG